MRLERALATHAGAIVASKGARIDVALILDMHVQLGPVARGPRHEEFHVTLVVVRNE